MLKLAIAAAAFLAPSILHADEAQDLQGYLGTVKADVHSTGAFLFQDGFSLFTPEGGRGIKATFAVGRDEIMQLRECTMENANAARKRCTGTISAELTVQDSGLHLLVYAIENLQVPPS